MGYSEAEAAWLPREEGPYVIVALEADCIVVLQVREHICLSGEDQLEEHCKGKDHVELWEGQWEEYLADQIVELGMRLTEHSYWLQMTGELGKLKEVRQPMERSHELELDPLEVVEAASELLAVHTEELVGALKDCSDLGKHC